MLHKVHVRRAFTNQNKLCKKQKQQISEKRKTNIKWFTFTGSSRQIALVSSETGSVDNIGYKKRNSRRSQGSFKQE